MLKDGVTEATIYNDNARFDNKLAAAPRVAIKALIAKIAADHGTTYEALQGPGRMAYIVRARCEAIAAIAKKYPQFSTPMIGKMFNRDHSTILWALHRAGMPPRNKQGLPTFARRHLKKDQHLGKVQGLGDGGTLTTKETPHGLD
jgi:hypothetical protein